MARSYFANVPISEPTPQGFTLDHDFGGIGWDQKKGMFIPVQGEVNQFTPPEIRPQDVAKIQNPTLQAPNAIQQLLATSSGSGTTLNSELQ